MRSTVDGIPAFTPFAAPVVIIYVFNPVSQFTLRSVRGSDLTNIKIPTFILSKGFKVIPMLGGISYIPR